MPFSITTDDGELITRSTDREDAERTAAKVANARECDVIVEDLVTLERITFSADSGVEDEPDAEPKPKRTRTRKPKA